MLLYIVILTLSVCGVDGYKAPELENLLRKQCRQMALSDLQERGRPDRGPPGVQGFQGYGGQHAPDGSVAGPPGVQNDTRIREIFQGYMEAVFRTVAWSTTLGVTLESCQDINIKLSQIPNVHSGVYEIYHPVVGWTNVYCDLDVDGGGWTVFQRRMDGSVDFFRGWGDYVHGFGDTNGEFWLGLEKVHQMTRYGDFELRIDMTRDNGTPVYVKYSSFRIGPSADYYRVSVSGYSGNGTNSFAHKGDPRFTQNNQQFSTMDADHDLTSTNKDLNNVNCADVHNGAWWYNQCMLTNLNGIYGLSQPSGVSWRNLTNSAYMFMTFTEMKFRPI